MKFFLDTANLNEIREGVELGLAIRNWIGTWENSNITKARESPIGS